MVPCCVFSVSVYAGNPEVLSLDASAGAAFASANAANCTTKPPAGETPFGRLSGSALDAAGFCGSALAVIVLVAVGPEVDAISEGRCAGSAGLPLASSASAGLA